MPTSPKRPNLRKPLHIAHAHTRAMWQQLLWPSTLTPEQLDELKRRQQQALPLEESTTVISRAP